MSRIWTHWAASSEILSVRAPRHDAGTGLLGEPLGMTVRGGPFIFDPFAAYQRGLVTNPNVAVVGTIGSGKSTVVKMLLARGLASGYRAVVIDPKGEYGALASVFDGGRVALGVTGWWNPFGPNESENLAFLVALLTTVRQHVLSDIEREQLEVRWREANCASAPRPLHALWRACQDHDDEFAATLRRFVVGDLAGLIDGDGTPIRPTSSLVVLDASAWWLSESLSVVSLVAWQMANTLLTTFDGFGYLVIDEAWALMQNEFATTWLQGAWKLARAHGVANIAVMHRVGDAHAGADAHTPARQRAVGIIKDCATYFLFHHGVGDLDGLNAVIGLTNVERDYLVALPRGSTLVHFGDGRSVVQLHPTATDRSFIDTDGAMR